MKRKLLMAIIALIPNLVLAVAIEITPEAADAALAFSDGFHWGVASIDLSG